MSKRYEQ